MSPVFLLVIFSILAYVGLICLTIFIVYKIRENIKTYYGDTEDALTATTIMGALIACVLLGISIACIADSNMFNLLVIKYCDTQIEKVSSDKDILYRTKVIECYQNNIDKSLKCIEANNKGASTKESE